jgi:hypothetical protein
MLNKLKEAVNKNIDKAMDFKESKKIDLSFLSVEEIK